MSFLTPGRSLMMFTNLFLCSGAYIADWSVTHVLNPRWPPHAKFHNGQTMTSSLLYTAATAYYLYRNQPNKQTQSESLFAAAIIGSFYSVSGLSAILYPGSLGIDPEFGEGFPQLYIFGAPLILNWVGYWLESRRAS
jgi:hypothetical protein